uniref:Glycosyltransferase 8 domain-containing protein 2 n=1 Tax=Oncorhynchus mykiss TaxID=8022 RepID=A0A8C7RDZ3_ONCMY
MSMHTHKLSRSNLTKPKLVVLPSQKPGRTQSVRQKFLWRRLRRERMTSQWSSVLRRNEMGGAMATINSIYSNTDASVFFYIVTLRDSIKLTRQYIEKTTLKGIKYKLLEFNPMLLKGKVKPDSSRPDMLHPLNFVRFYLPLLDISHKRVIYLDDVIVQGTDIDIKDLYHTKLEKGRAAAFATDCDLPSTHEMVRSMGMQDNVHGLPGLQEVRDLGINPSDCSFNPGVFVADIGEWKKQKITKQLEKYSAMAGGVATPPMLTVFHDKYAIIDPLWHQRHVQRYGPDARNSETFLQGAHLLHWNSRFKPWDYPCVHLDRWEKWFIPDPTRKFLLVRLEGKI